MNEVIELSSDSEPEQLTSPAPKRRSIEGIPRSFQGDNKTRFSFGVSFLENKDESNNTISKIDETNEVEEVEEGGSNTPVMDRSMDDMFNECMYSPTPIVFPQRTPTRLNSSFLCKTPKSSVRRRSVSVSKLSSESPKKSNRAPISQLCSSFVISEKELETLSSDTDEELIDSDRDDNGEEEEEGDNDLNLRALLSPQKTNKTKGSKKVKTKEVQNEFFGVYCLISRSDKSCYKNRCYVGYTVDPNRRIMQHNGGRLKGGAKKTDSRGPWDMVCVVHGFPNHVAALRFEWAWQNPNTSKILKEKELKKERKETPFQYHLRISCHLMSSQPFCRYALSFRWLITKEEIPFPISCIPPEHTKKKYGKVKKEMSLVPEEKKDYVEMGECRLCGEDIDKLWHFCRCLSPKCSAHFHLKCLAENGLKNNRTDDTINTQLFPYKSNCPSCCSPYLWGDIIREHRRVIKVSNSCADEFKLLVVRKGLPHREVTPPLAK